MSSYCSVLLVGRAGGPPEERQSGAGKRWCNFRLAVNRTEGPQRQPVSDWFTIVAFEATADAAMRSVQKGDLVLVDGRLQTRQFEGQDGKLQQRVEVVAGRIRTLQRNGPRVELPAGSDAVIAMPAPVTAWELEPAVPF
jgi:single-strand DNA-binding protein